jgi:hypothetical protein
MLNSHLRNRFELRKPVSLIPFAEIAPDMKSFIRHPVHREAGLKDFADISPQLPDHAVYSMDLKHPSAFLQAIREANRTDIKSSPVVVVSRNTSA